MMPFLDRKYTKKKMRPFLPNKLCDIYLPFLDSIATVPLFLEFPKRAKR